MFSFVFFDTKTNEIIAARDHFGQKPLYFSNHSSEFTVSSDPYCVAKSGPSCEPDIESYYLYLSTSGRDGVRGLCDPRRTFFRGVSALPAGHYIWYKEGKLRVRQYFEQHAGLCDKEYARLKNISLPEFITEFRVRLGDAVEQVSVADVKQGISLSGGIDSSLIYRELLSRIGPFESFTKLCPGIEKIPQAVIPKLLSYGKENHDYKEENLHYVEVLKETYLSGMVEFIVNSACPQRWGSGPEMSKLYSVIRKAGVKVSYSGDSADEQYCGYLGYEAAYRNTYSDFIGEYTSARNIASGAKESIGVADYQEYYQKKLIVIENALSEYPELDKRRKTRMMLDSDLFLQACVFPHADSYSMQNSVELRAPFADMSLARFAINIPLDVLTPPIGANFGKFLLRQDAISYFGKFMNMPKEGTRHFGLQATNVQLNPESLNISDCLPIQSLNLENTNSDKFRLINLEVFHQLFFGNRDLDIGTTKEILTSIFTGLE